MDGFTRLLEEKFLPIAAKLQANIFLGSLRNGLVASMPMMIVGSMVIVVAELPVEAYQNMMLSVFGENWKWFNWGVIYASTMGLVAPIATVGVAYAYIQQKGKPALPAAMIALSGFWILLHQQDVGGYATTYLGAQGLFAGMTVAIVTAMIYDFVLEKGWTIKLPEQVPPAISNQFMALTPAAIAIIFWTVVRFVFAHTDYVTYSGFIMQVLQTPLTRLGTGLGGSLIAEFFVQLFWFVGIHGANVVGSVMTPIYEAATLANLAASQAGEPLPYIVTAQFVSNLVRNGGSGATLSLVFIMTFLAKSDQIKYIGRLSMGPGLFNINETVTFGLPIIMNPMMMIPFFLAPMSSVLISYLAISSGLVGRLPGLAAPWTTPIIVSGFYIGNGDVRVVILQLVTFVVTGLIYFPFIAAWDKAKYAEEQGAA